MTAIQVRLDNIGVLDDEYLFKFDIVEKVKNGMSFSDHDNSLVIIAMTTGSLNDAHQDALHRLAKYGEQLSAWANGELRKFQGS